VHGSRPPPLRLLRVALDRGAAGRDVVAPGHGGRFGGRVDRAVGLGQQVAQRTALDAADVRRGRLRSSTATSSADTPSSRSAALWVGPVPMPDCSPSTAIAMASGRPSPAR
jgi:hypothetical protein